MLVKIENTDVIQRLQRLERQNRLVKCGIVIVTLCSASLLLMGQVLPTTNVVEAEAFILVNAEGEKEAELSLRDPLGGPQLILYSAPDQPAV